MDRETQNRLRRLAGVPQDFSVEPKSVNESLGVQYTNGVGATTSNPSNFVHPRQEEIDAAVEQEEEDRYGRHRTDVDAGEKDHHSDGDMVHRQVKNIMHNAETLLRMIDEDDNLPAWVASKITKAADYLDTATDYIRSEMNEADTSHKFKKGQIVKYKGERVKVVVPDAKANFVGVVPVGQEENPEDVDLVRADKLEIVNEGMVDKAKSAAKKAHKAFMWSDTDPEELRQYVRDASDETLKALAGKIGEKPLKGSPRDHQMKVIRNELLKRFGQIKTKEMLGEMDQPEMHGLERVDNEGGAPMYRRVEEKSHEEDEETTEFKTFTSWKNTLTRVYNNIGDGIEITGDESKASASVKKGGKRHSVGHWDGSKGMIKHGVVHESAHHHSDGHYPETFADAKSHRSAINSVASYDTVHDEPDFEEDEEDYMMANDTEKVTVPSRIMNDLKKVIDEVKQECEKAKRRQQDERSHYYDATAEALTRVHDYLSMKTIEGLKRAQLAVNQMANPSRALIPDNVWKFIIDGGTRRSLRDYHNEVKKYPIVGPRNTLNDRGE